ncbi:MAG TPA: SDR family oxidoreductase [Microvirga sp.]|jgi:NAD(P)-dependent dehydrogenase (short-subunit alcohol dehydrogenase family)|nr:SDR family oxidoreductase [Microvirga sp.]
MLDHPFSLTGQTVLVVGASSGIGAATAALANRLGARVILASRSTDALAKVRAGIERPGDAEMIAFDYLDAEAVRAALALFDRIDHVVIPAVADENKKRGAFLELDEAVMRASFDKFWGQVNVLRAVVPKMPAGGSATLFGSIAGLKPTGKDAGLSVMNGVQAAVIQLGRSLAVELAPLRVNVIAPGVVLTGVWTEAQRTDLADWMEKTLPAQRAGRAEDLAQAAISLATNPYVTGAVLTVDGGLHLV